MGESKLKIRGLQGVRRLGQSGRVAVWAPQVGEPGTGSQGLGPARLAATGLEQTPARTSDFVNHLPTLGS